MGKLKVDLLGTSFTIQANEDTEYLDKLLGYYKQITQDIEKIDSVKTPLQIAILSGIMLCDELYKEKQRKITMQNTGGQVSTENDEEIELRTKQMIEKISKVL
mgnify:FL=1